MAIERIGPSGSSSRIGRRSSWNSLRSLVFFKRSRWTFSKEFSMIPLRCSTIRITLINGYKRFFLYYTLSICKTQNVSPLRSLLKCFKNICFLQTCTQHATILWSYGNSITEFVLWFIGWSANLEGRAQSSNLNFNLEFQASQSFEAFETKK